MTWLCARSTFKAAGSKPYVATSLKLDDGLLSTLLAEVPESVSSRTTPSFSVAPVSPALLEAWDHHLALLETPEDIQSCTRPVNENCSTG